MSAAEFYSQQSNPAFETELAARTATRDAGFLLPFLRPGMQLLDVGCGPGSITLDFAERVAPGQVVGIDIQSAMVERARALAATRLVANVRFEIADIYRLPFADGTFDAVFANGVLMHLRKPEHALAEVRRVLRSGGIAGIRDPDFGAMLHVPTTPLLDRWLALRVKVRQHNGGNPFLSRLYRRLMLEAGFARVKASAAVHSGGFPDETRRHAVFLKAQLSGLARTAISQGWMDQPMVEQVAAEIDAWAQRPDAFSATMWCQTIGWASSYGPSHRRYACPDSAHAPTESAGMQVAA